MISDFSDTRGHFVHLPFLQPSADSMTVLPGATEIPGELCILLPVHPGPLKTSIF